MKGPHEDGSRKEDLCIGRVDPEGIFYFNTYFTFMCLEIKFTRYY